MRRPTFLRYAAALAVLSLGACAGTTCARAARPQPPANGHVSAYDHRYAFWGSLHETSLRLFERYPFLSGIFVWQGIDYLGEPTPYEWPARSSYFGTRSEYGSPLSQKRSVAHTLAAMR